MLGKHIKLKACSYIIHVFVYVCIYINIILFGTDVFCVLWWQLNAPTVEELLHLNERDCSSPFCQLCHRFFIVLLRARLRSARCPPRSVFVCVFVLVSTMVVHKWPIAIGIGDREEPCAGF